MVQVRKNRRVVGRMRLVVTVLCGVLIFFLVSVWALREMGSRVVYSVGEVRGGERDKYSDAVVEHFLEEMRNARLKFD